MSGQEIFVIIIVILLLFGADKLPEIAKSVSKGMRDFRKATDDIRREFEESTSEIRKDLTDVTSSLTNDVNDISQNIKQDADEVADNLRKDVNDFQNTVNSDLNEVKENLEADPAKHEEPSTGAAGEQLNAEAPDFIDNQTSQPSENQGTAENNYKRTINEPDDNYYNYRD